MSGHNFITAYANVINMDLFNLYLQLPEDELWWELPIKLELPLEGITFRINPRRLRGSDFLMRWSQGRWAEEVVINALNESENFGAIPYGPSVVAPEDPSELGSFFENNDLCHLCGRKNSYH